MKFFMGIFNYFVHLDVTEAQDISSILSQEILWQDLRKDLSFLQNMP